MANATDLTWSMWLARWRDRGMRRMRTAWRPHALYLHGATGSVADVQATVDAFGQWCARHEGAVCRLALSSRWLLSSTVPPGQEKSAMRREAMQQWAHYHDVDEAVLAAEWVYREALHTDVALAVAAPRALVAGLMAHAKAHGVRVDAVQPWWAQAVRAWLRRPEAVELKLLEPGLVTHVQVNAADAGGARVQALWVEAATGHEWEADDGSGNGSVLRLPTPAHLADAATIDPAQPKWPPIWPPLWSHAELADVLMGQLPPSQLAQGGKKALWAGGQWSAMSWADELDFIGPPIRTASWSWLLLLAGLCALGAVWPLLSEAETELQSSQDAVKRLQRATHQHTLRHAAPRRARSNGPAGGGDDVMLGADKQRAAARLAQNLAYPWMATLVQVETAAMAQHAVLLSFSVDLSTLDGRRTPNGDASPDVRLSAAVMDDTQALRWAQAHEPHAQLSMRDRLPATLATPLGAYEWRVEAVWKGGTP